MTDIEEKLEGGTGDGAGEPPKDDGHARRRMTFFAVVVGTMAVVIAIWVLLLPAQFTRFTSPDPLKAARWTVVSEAKRGKEDFLKTLSEIEDRMEELTKMAPAAGNSSTGPAADQAFPDAAEMTKKLEDAVAGQAAGTTGGTPPGAAQNNVNTSGHETSP